MFLPWGKEGLWVKCFGRKKVLKGVRGERVEVGNKSGERGMEQSIWKQSLKEGSSLALRILGPG